MNDNQELEKLKAIRKRCLRGLRQLVILTGLVAMLATVLHLVFRTDFVTCASITASVGLFAILDGVIYLIYDRRIRNASHHASQA